MPESKPLKPEKESKSQQKRDMLALQKMGESLMTLTETQLAAIDLPDNLQVAIQQAKSLKSNEAKRRQLQYIGKLMRHVDPEPIMQALKNIQHAHDSHTQQFKQTEAWRRELLAAGDEALNRFLSEYPQSDIQHLRQLIRKAQQDVKNAKNTGAETALFRYLRSILAS